MSTRNNKRNSAQNESNSTVNNAANNSLSYWSILDKATQIVLTTICCDTKAEAEKHLKMLCKTHKLPSKATCYEVRHDFTDNNGVVEVNPAIQHDIQPKAETATDKAAKAAAKAAEREAKKAAREAAKADRKFLLERAGSLNQALKCLQGLENEVMPSGITVKAWFNAKGINGKLTVSSYRAALNPELVREDGIYGWQFVKACFDNGVAEDDRNGKAVEVYVSKSKTWKKAGTYQLVKLDGKFTAAKLIALLDFSVDYKARRDRQLKADKVMQTAKQFRIEAKRSFAKGKLTISYADVEKANVKF